MPGNLLHRAGDLPPDTQVILSDDKGEAWSRVVERIAACEAALVAMIMDVRDDYETALDYLEEWPPADKEKHARQRYERARKKLWRRDERDNPEDGS